MPRQPAIKNAWTATAEDVLSTLQVNPAQGLNTETVLRQRRRHGANRLRKAVSRGPWRILIDQFASLMMGILAAAVLLALLMGDWVDAAAIAMVILINAAIGFVTEFKAVRSMEALQRLGQMHTRVRRDGRVQDIPAAELVSGDIVLIEGGDVVTADLRLISASRLEADESTLTGESLPVPKAATPVPPDTPLAERASMLFKGTAVTRGSAEAVVVAVGYGSELGQIASLTQRTDAAATPLEIRLEQMGRRLIWLTLALTAVLVLVGVVAGRDFVLMLETAIALAVATIPEGLPVVATIALARGMWRMARRNALVTRLSAVETLGATGIICTDKTGTLTENRMSVARLALADAELALSRGQWSQDGQPLPAAEHAPLRAALETGALCNNAEWQPGEPARAVGDPMEIALLAAAATVGIERPALVTDWPELREEAFDPASKMMATFHQGQDGLRVAVKGAPEAVLAACNWIMTGAGEQALGPVGRAAWLARNEMLAGEGLRILALATRSAATVDESPYEDLVLLGLVAFLDPPRADVPDAIAACRTAGIRVVMLTGDQAVTAGYIARAVGMSDDDQLPQVLTGADIFPADELDAASQARLRAAGVFARVEPKQKLDLIELHQLGGMVVAMTGDGVNDAPALKKADIGVAMGQRGTQVAREAADMVLKDDAFGTIVHAVEQGRIIFDNIRKFVLYLLSCNVSEVMIVALATFANAPLPLLPLQILFLNLVTDVFPALALGVGPGDRRIMQRPPRPADEPILTARHWWTVIGHGLTITIATLGAFALALLWLGYDQHAAVTVSFLTLAFAQLWHVFNMRDRAAGLVRNDVTRNPWVWGALALCLFLVAAALYLAPLDSVLQLTPPTAKGWTLVVLCSLLPLLLGPLVTGLTRRRNENEAQ